MKQIVKYKYGTAAKERALPKQSNHFLIGLICKYSRLENNECLKDQHDFLHNKNQNQRTGCHAQHDLGYNWVQPLTLKQFCKILTLSVSKSNRSIMDCQAGAFFWMYLWIKMKSMVEGRNQSRLQAASNVSFSIAASRLSYVDNKKS